MKAECVKEKIGRALYQAEKIAGRNPTLPVLSCVLLEAKNSAVFVRATNLSLGIEIQIPAKVEREGVVAVPGGPFSDFVANVPLDKSLRFSVEGKNLSVVGSNTKAVILAVAHDDFPTIPKTEAEHPFPVNSADLARGFKSVWYSASVSSVKPELASVLMRAEGDELVFAATDSFRLAEKKIKLKKPKEMPAALIPLKNIAEILRVLEGASQETVVGITKNQISFSTDGVYLVSRLIEGVFPDYQQVIPKERATEAILLKEDLLQALRLANIFSGTFNEVAFKLSPKNKTFLVSTKNGALGENTTKVEASLSGEEIECSFNYKYIAECLSSVESDSVTLSFGGASRPLVIRGVSDRSFLYLVMPMNK